MKNRFLCALLALIIALAILPSAVFAEEAAKSDEAANHEGLDNFTEKNKFTNKTFSDVSTDDWFYTNVAYAYVHGLMNGKSDIEFKPKSNVKLSETVAVAARLNMIYTTGVELSPTPTADSTGKWYDYYVDYAKEKGIIRADYEDYEKIATRAEFAEILAAALPDEALDEINLVPDTAIPDVSGDEEYAPAVYKLYRAGIIVGNNDAGNFNPDRNITRAEVSAIISRMISREQRESVTLNSTVERRFDKNGNLTYECTTRYNEDGQIVSRHQRYFGDKQNNKHTYDDSFNFAEQLKKQKDGDIVFKYTGDESDVKYTYDDFSNLVKLIKKNKDGDITYKYTADYNENNLLTKEYKWYADRTVLETKYTYDESNNLVKIIRKNKDGDVTYKYTAAYNKNNLVTKEYKWYADNTVLETRFTYNNSNDIIKVVRETKTYTITLDFVYKTPGYQIKLILSTKSNEKKLEQDYSFTYDANTNTSTLNELTPLTNFIPGRDGNISLSSSFDSMDSVIEEMFYRAELSLK